MIKFIVFCTKIIIVTVVALLFASCNNGIEGNGDVKTEKRTITEKFTKIESSSGVEVLVEQSDSVSVAVEADSNLLQYITTTVENGVLKVSISESIHSSEAEKVHVKVPVIEGLASTSGSDIKTTNVLKGTSIALSSSSGSEINATVEYENVAAETTSGSTATVSGKALKFAAKSSSGSELNASSLEANDVTAESTSGSSCDVTAQVSLKAKASSGSSVEYGGLVKTVSKEENSGGSVSKR